MIFDDLEDIGSFESLEELQRFLANKVNSHNNIGQQDFEGYSPSEMKDIIHFTFSKESPIKLRRLNDSDFKEIPIFNQVMYLLDLIAKNGELKLTKKGFLPTKVVAELYSQGFIKDEFIESGISKLYKETDSMSINLTRILIEMSRLVKKRNGKYSLTKSSEKLIVDKNELFKTIFTTFTTKFNWAYYDRYGNNSIGQLGYGFSLILLSKYGKKERLDSFYADKYFTAFPTLRQPIVPGPFGIVKDISKSCYSIRTFDRFMDYFGFINLKVKRVGYKEIKYISKTKLYDKLIKCEPHKAWKG